MLLLVTPEVSAGDLLQGGAIFLSIIGSAIAFWISRQQDRKLRAAEYVAKTWEMWVEEMGDAEDMIIQGSLDCDKYWEKDDGKLYTLLSFLEIICLMKKSRVISKDDLALYAYDIVIVHGNEEVRKYISKIDEELSKKRCRVKIFAESRATYRDLTAKDDAATQEDKRQLTSQSSEKQRA
jgi:hypothetical protein